MTRLRRRQRGTSLIEILISLAVVMVGMLALFKTLSTSIVGSATASRLTQAQQRAVLVMESIRVAPKAVLSCLVSTNPAANWTACETTCLTTLTGTTKTKDSCTYVSLNQGLILKADTDSNAQKYYVVSTNASGPITQVTLPPSAGLTAALYESQVVIGWNDENTDASSNPAHYVVLRSGVYQP